MGVCVQLSTSRKLQYPSTRSKGDSSTTGEASTSTTTDTQQSSYSIHDEIGGSIGNCGWHAQIV
jgi:hypothetical protein